MSIVDGLLRHVGRKLAEKTASPESKVALQGVELRMGEVVSVAGNVASIYLSGDTTQEISGIKSICDSPPAAGDIVWVLKNGTDRLIVGTKSYRGIHRTLKGKLLTNSAVTTMTINVTTRQLVTGFTLTAVPVVLDRHYRIWACGSGAVNSTTDGYFVILKTGVTTSDGIDLDLMTVNPRTNTNVRTPWHLERVWKSTLTGTIDLVVAAARVTANATVITVGNAGAADPGHLFVEEYADNTQITII